MPTIFVFVLFCCFYFFLGAGGWWYVIIVKPEEKILCVAFLYNHSYIETFNQILSFCEIVTKDIIRIVTFSEQTV